MSFRHKRKAREPICMNYDLPPKSQWVILKDLKNHKLNPESISEESKYLWTHHIWVKISRLILKSLKPGKSIILWDAIYSYNTDSCVIFVYYSHRVIGVYILLRHSHTLVYLQLSKRSIFKTGHVRAVINLRFNHACETAQSRAIFIYLYH